MKSLEENMLDCEIDLEGKKIVAIQIMDIYPIGYIIVEGGQYIAITDDEDGDIYQASIGAVERALYYNEHILKIFLENGCISQTYYDSIQKRKENEDILKKERIKELEYKRYLELKAIYEKNS